MGRGLHGFIFIALFAAAFLAPAAARATTTVRVLETWPAGEAVTLAPNQTFYLRLHYEAERPTHIWARPFIGGQAAKAGSNPSRLYEGTGEALGWFFLTQPDAEVDEVRIEVGDGTAGGSGFIATYPVHITADAGSPSASAAAPAWVGELSRRAQAAQQAAARERAATTQTTPWLGGIMLLGALVALFGLGAPAWALMRWRNSWRLAAAVPAAIMLFVVLRIVVDVARDPTSHNLWPFEIFMAGAFCGVVVIVIALVRRLLGTTPP
jgi:hypothetical protein